VQPNDVNVTGVWSQGIYGAGVVVSIVDDGVDFKHPDLADNYVS
jgi:subtilisin family serine protease